MAKYRNSTASFQSFSIPMPDGSVRWISAKPNEMIEMEEKDAWRAEAHGFVTIEKIIKSIEPTKPTVPIAIKSKKKRR